MLLTVTDAVTDLCVIVATFFALPRRIRCTLLRFARSPVAHDVDLVRVDAFRVTVPSMAKSIETTTGHRGRVRLAHSWTLFVVMPFVPTDRSFA